MTRQPKIIVEIGVWNGDTGLILLKTALSLRPDAFYFGIDLWELLTPMMKEQEHCTKKDFSYNTVRKKFEAAFPKIVTRRHPFTISKTAQHKSSNYAHFALAQGISHVELERFRKSELERTFGTQYVDFVFIDGGHSLETIMKDWMVVQSIMDEKTVVIFDDYYPNTNLIGARNIIEFIVKKGEFNVEYLEPIDQFTFPDGSPQPTQMVKVTRRAINKLETPQAQE